MLLMDGVRYQLWEPKNEDEFEQVVKEHAQEIFGENSIYLDRKQRLKSLSGIGTIPDGYVIKFDNPPQWHIVEVELSSHDLYGHIVPQVTKFTTGISNLGTQRDLLNAIDHDITRDDFLKLKLAKAIGTGEVYRFLSSLVSQPPILTIIIEKSTTELEDVKKTLSFLQIKVVEFQTFTREAAGLTVHAHLFEPLYQPVVVPPIAPKIVADRPPPYSSVAAIGSTEVVLNKIYAPRKWAHIPISGRQRGLFPGFKVDFELETDKGVLTCHVSSAPRGTPIGDPIGGKRIQGGLASWYNAHSELKDGATLLIKEIEPKKKYSLEIKKSIK